jgi:hypothetical protein
MMVKWIFAHVTSNVYPKSDGNQWTNPPVIVNSALVGKTLQDKIALTFDHS